MRSVCFFRTFLVLTDFLLNVHLKSRNVQICILGQFLNSLMCIDKNI